MDLSPLLSQVKDACSWAGYTKAETLIRLMEDRMEETRRAERAKRDSLLYTMKQALAAQYTLERLRVHKTIEETEEDIGETCRILETFVKDVRLGLTLQEAADLVTSLHPSASFLQSERANLARTEHSLQQRATDLLEREAGSLFSSPFLVSSRVSLATTCEATRTAASLELLHDAITRLRASQGERLGELERKLGDDLELIRAAFSSSLAGLSRRLAAYGAGETRQALQTQARRARRAGAEARDVAALLASLASS